MSGWSQNNNGGQRRSGGGGFGNGAVQASREKTAAMRAMGDAKNRSMIAMSAATNATNLLAHLVEQARAQGEQVDVLAKWDELYDHVLSTILDNANGEADGGPVTVERVANQAARATGGEVVQAQPGAAAPAAGGGDLAAAEARTWPFGEHQGKTFGEVAGQAMGLIRWGAGLTGKPGHRDPDDKAACLLIAQARGAA